MSKPSMSEILKGTEEALKLADSQDVSKLHDFLFAEPGKPMLFVGNGGMQGHYASKPAIRIFPYQGQNTLCPLKL